MMGSKIDIFVLFPHETTQYQAQEMSKILRLLYFLAS